MSRKRRIKAILVAALVAFAMAVITPFSGVYAVDNVGNVTTIEKSDFKSAYGSDGYDGTPSNGVSCNGGYFTLSPGNYKLGNDITGDEDWIEYELWFGDGEWSLDLAEYEMDLCVWTYPEEDDDQVKLSISGNGTVGCPVWIEGNSSVTISGGTYLYGVAVAYGAELTIDDAEIKGNVAKQYINDNDIEASLLLYDGGSLTINGGSFGGGNGDYISAGLYASTRDVEKYPINVTINGGTFAGMVAAGVQGASSININGGTFGSYNEEYGGLQVVEPTISMTGLYTSSCASINISGGEFAGQEAGFASYGGDKKISIAGGEFTGFVGFGVMDYNNENTSLTLSGGTFNAKEEYVDGKYASIVLANTTADTDTFDSILAEGYKFDPELSPENNGSYLISGVESVSVVKDVKECTVTFETNGGSKVEPQTIESGSTAKKPSDPTKSGNDFGGWFADSTFKTAFDFGKAITEDCTVYAKWTETEKESKDEKSEKVTVSFDVNGGSPVAAQTIDKGSKAERPDNPSKPGFTFDDWYTDKTFTEKFDFGKAISADCTAYAKWNGIKEEDKDDSGEEEKPGDNNEDASGQGSETGNGSDATSTPETSTAETSTADYKNEWVEGKWYGADGSQNYTPKGGWKCNSIGWWYEDESGWYPTDQWQKIDGKWYYFDKDGYMLTNQYAGNWDSYSEGSWWVGADGAWDGSQPGVWRLAGDKWYFTDSTGWFAKNQYLKIRGIWFWFNSEGYWEE